MKPAYRVARSPVDQFFDKGPPPPPTRMGSGDVLSIESDTVTVNMHGTVVAGVAVQGDMPGVGDQIDVWSQEDLLYTPGDLSSGGGGDDTPHIVSTRRPGTGSDTEINIAGSFNDDSWFFDPEAMPDWMSDAREDGTGLEITRDGTDNDGILWSPSGFDVRPGDELVFTVSATYLDDKVTRMTTVVCWGTEDTDPLPDGTTHLSTYSPTVQVDGVDEEMETTIVVPSTVSTTDNGSIVPLSARIGILFQVVTVDPYATKVMALGPPIWYFRYENTTTNVDSSGNARFWNNGYGASTDVPGLYPGGGRARSYPGTGESQLLGSVVPTATNVSCTFAAGVKFTGGTGDWNILASIVGAIAAGHTIMFGFDDTGHPLTKCYGGGTEISAIATMTVGTTATHHVVWTWNATTFEVKIWVDGVVVLTANNGGPIRTGSGLRDFGGGNGRYFKGVVDEPAWYDRLLSDIEITDLAACWAAGL